MYHVFALLAVAVIYQRFSNKLMQWSGIFFITGIILFSGSLYLLTALKATDTAGLSGIGLITPFGGLFFIAGWLLLFLGVMKNK